MLCHENNVAMNFPNDFGVKCDLNVFSWDSLNYSSFILNNLERQTNKHKSLEDKCVLIIGDSQNDSEVNQIWAKQTFGPTSRGFLVSMGMRRGGVVIWERVGERWLYSLWSCAVCLVCRAYRAERSMTNTAQQVRAINYTQAWMREGWGDIEREEQRARYAQCHLQGKLTLDFKAMADPHDEATAFIASWTSLSLITPVAGPETDTQCQRI